MQPWPDQLKKLPPELPTPTWPFFLVGIAASWLLTGLFVVLSLAIYFLSSRIFGTAGPNSSEGPLILSALGLGFGVAIACSVWTVMGSEPLPARLGIGFAVAILQGLAVDATFAIAASGGVDFPITLVVFAVYCVAQIPLWILFAMHMRLGSASSTSEPQLLQFHLKHILIGMFLIALALGLGKPFLSFAGSFSELKFFTLFALFCLALGMISTWMLLGNTPGTLPRCIIGMLALIFISCIQLPIFEWYMGSPAGEKLFFLFTNLPFVLAASLPLALARVAGLRLYWKQR